jgi:hypothetical protein
VSPAQAFTSGTTTVAHDVVLASITLTDAADECLKRGMELASDNKTCHHGGVVAYGKPAKVCFKEAADKYSEKKFKEEMAKAKQEKNPKIRAKKVGAVNAKAQGGKSGGRAGLVKAWWGLMKCATVERYEPK